MKHWILIFTLLCMAVPLSASIAIDPLRVEVLAQPGEKIKGFYTVTNPKDFPMSVTIQSKNYVTLEENKDFPHETWLKVSPKEFRLDSNGTKQINYTIKVPKKAKGFLMVFNSFLPRKVDEKGAIIEEMLNTVLSIPIYVIIEGTQKVSAEIEKVDIAGDSRTISVMVTVRNTGNIYLRPAGEVIVYQKKAEVARIPLKEGWPVFPDNKESYQGKQGGFDLKPGTYAAIARLESLTPQCTLEQETVFTIDKKGMIQK